MIRTLRLLCVAVILAVALPVLGKSAYPEPTGHVNDFAHLLSTTSQQNLENLLTELQQKTGAQIAVVTVPTLNDIPIEDYASDLFKAWGIGEKGKENGLLFLIAPNERKVRFEVGYGLESILPDGKTGHIQDQYVVPAFRAGDMAQGIVQGTQATVNVIAEHYKLNPDELPAATQLRTPQKQKTSFAKKVAQLIFIIFLIILFIRHPSLFVALLFMTGSGSGGRSGSGFGGGFGGFGGGGSGGGGSSRSW